MSEKKQKKKPGLDIKTRTPQKRGIFDNIGANRTTDPHPLREILNFPSSPLPTAAEEIEKDDARISAINLDAQNETKMTPNLDNLDAQNVSSETPKFDLFGQPNVSELGVQNSFVGRPNAEVLDAKTPKKKIWTPKESKDLDAKTSKEKVLDAQKSSKKGKWQKYETNRATDRVALRPSVESLRKFKVFCAEKDYTLTEFFEISGMKFIELDAQMTADLGVLTPYDDRRLIITWKSKPVIINLYLRYNLIFNPNSKWKTRDDEAAFAYNEVDIRIVELGIIQAQSNKFASDPHGSINSFKFYINEIENYNRIGLKAEILDVMLEVNRRRWREITGKEIDLSFLKTEKEVEE